MSYGLVRRLSAAARSVVVGAAPSRPRPLRLSDVERGWVVVDVDGRRVGRVESVTGTGLVVRAGWPSRHVAVPAHEIAEMSDGRIRLTRVRH